MSFSSGHRAPGTAGSARALQVVLADDGMLFRELLRLIIDAEPDLAVVAEARNGREAVEHATDLVPDVVVMDVRMPVMDGIEATREIARTAPNVRVVGLSGESDAATMDAMFEAGAAGYVVKAGGSAELLRVIRSVNLPRAPAAAPSSALWSRAPSPGSSSS